jgi:type VI secretion system protein ImpE
LGDPKKENGLTMDAKDLIRAGKLAEARSLLVAGVKAAPADAGRRTLLFQVLCLLGEWDKASLHLDTLGAQDLKAQVGVQVYRNLIHAEKEREEVFTSGRRPSFMPNMPPYAESFFQIWDHIAEGRTEEAEAAHASIFEALPLPSGTLNSNPFTGFRDTDSFLSPFLESFVHDRYVWLPIAAVRELTIAPPKTLFDTLWMSGHLTTWEGLAMNCFLPVLYPLSHRHEDDRVKLGRMTDWKSAGGSFVRAMGQHVFEVGEEDVNIMEIRELVFSLD